MNLFKILICFCLLTTNFFFSQGIFKTANDFRNSNYLLKSNVKSKFKVVPFGVFNSSKIKVKHGDSTFSFLKSEIYGYQDDEHSYRFYKGERYTIINPSESILIYSKIVLAGTKGNVPTEVYFFSQEAGSEILPLTNQNLKTTFQGNTKFYDLLMLYFKKDSDLLAYDEIKKMYILNYLLHISINS